MNNLKKYAFADLYDMASGISSTKDQAGHGAPFVSFSTVFNNYFLPDELPDLMDTSEKEQEIYSIKEGDILITRTSETIDELAMSCVATKDYPKATYSGFTKRLRPKTEKIAYSKYLAFYLRGYLFRKAVTNNAFMTLRASFNEDIFSFLNLHLPDYEQQVKIGDLLYLIEQKIQLNKKINDNLEQMANQLYEYWFIQFQFPNNDNNPYKLSGSPMVYNSLLKIEIPEGWRVKTVASLLDKVPNTLRVQNAEYKSSGNIPIVDQSASLIAGYTDNTDALLSDEHGYIVFGDHTRVVKYIRFPFARGADGTQILKSSLSCMPTELLYHTITHIDLSNQGYARHFKFLKDSLVIVPNDDIAQKFAVQVSIWHEQQKQLLFENMKLSKLRDWLLPMLMNGQATIDD